MLSVDSIYDSSPLAQYLECTSLAIEESPVIAVNLGDAADKIIPQPTYKPEFTLKDPEATDEEASNVHPRTRFKEKWAYLIKLVKSFGDPSTMIALLFDTNVDPTSIIR
jgi:hypothetical protein